MRGSQGEIKVSLKVFKLLHNLFAQMPHTASLLAIIPSLPPHSFLDPFNWVFFVMLNLFCCTSASMHHRSGLAAFLMKGLDVWWHKDSTSPRGWFHRSPVGMQQF